MQRLFKRQAGFTLIELIIVMVIIGILVLLLLPNLANGPKKARDTQRKSDLRSVQTALEQYFADKNGYPNGNFSGLTAQLVPDYIKSIPSDPKTGGTPYAYTPAPTGCAVGACTSYAMTAALEYAKDPSYPTYTVNSQQ